MSRRAIAGVGAACVFVAACGGGPTAPSAAVRFSVMTFNIQHGIDGTNHYNLHSAIDTIARTQPDVVGLQEVTRNHPSYNCDDQPALISSGLRAATGEAWSVVYQQQWFTPDTTCVVSGRGDANESEGLALLSRQSLGSTTSDPLFDGGLGLVAMPPFARGVPIAVTHLAATASNASVRTSQLGTLLPWAAGLGEPRILVGDFNAFVTDREMQPVFAAYHDAWADAQQMGRAVGDAVTHKGDRIDYVFFVPGTRLTLESAAVIDPAALIGVEASDHRPVVATFTIR